VAEWIDTRGRNVGIVCQVVGEVEIRGAEERGRLDRLPSFARAGSEEVQQRIDPGRLHVRIGVERRVRRAGVETRIATSIRSFTL
jgi:hypothetical protein